MAPWQAFHLTRDKAHLAWNNRIDPAVEVNPGAVVVLEVNNASGGQLDRHSTVEDVAQLDFSRINPVTGPVFVKGAEAGDALVLDILAVDVDAWGWTANIPGFGLLADQFQEPHLRISRVTGTYAELLPGLRIPTSPFIGTIGVAPAAAGDHSVVPPRPVGGNMDVRHVTPGARLVLPVEVPGALLSLGDTHAAQGDGEVCGTAVEISSVVTFRVGLAKGEAPRFPVLHTHPRSARFGRAVATTGIGPDLFQAARDAVSSMIEHLGQSVGLDPVDAYLLCSVAADLRISEIVDQPHWVVSLHLERDILQGGMV